MQIYGNSESFSFAGRRISEAAAVDPLSNTPSSSPKNTWLIIFELGLSLFSPSLDSWVIWSIYSQSNSLNYLLTLLGPMKSSFGPLVELMEKDPVFRQKYTFYGWDQPGYIVSQPPRRKLSDTSFHKNVEIGNAFLQIHFLWILLVGVTKFLCFTDAERSEVHNPWLQRRRFYFQWSTRKWWPSCSSGEPGINSKKRTLSSMNVTQNDLHLYLYN